MRSPIFETRFKKDIKRLQKRGKDMNKLKTVIERLLENQPLVRSLVGWVEERNPKNNFLLDCY